MKKRIILIVGTLFLIVSIGLALYPTVSNEINKLIMKDTINQYNNQVMALTDSEKSECLAKARKYNENLSNIVSDSFSPDAYNVDPSYKEILDFSDDGLIGKISIPTINVNLPIYHGINENYLNKGSVHMCNTSFPIGGVSTHGVISAHTAYPSKEFFDNLKDLKIGDHFYITVLGNTLGYTVKDINIVLPNDTRLLKIVNGEDLITLVTCTPYSVNTHRLLVTGIRDKSLETKDNKELEKQDKGSSNIIIIISTSVILVLIFIIILIVKRRKKRIDKKN